MLLFNGALLLINIAPIMMLNDKYFFLYEKNSYNLVSLICNTI